jgi:hypothetical protein
LSLTQSFETGELWGISAEIFDEPIPMVAFERLHVFVLVNYVNIMTRELNLYPPYSVELGLVGLKDVYLGLPGPTQPFGSKTAPSSVGPMMENSLRIRDTLGDISDSSIKNALGAYFRHLYELAGYTRADALTDYTVSTWGLPPR